MNFSSPNEESHQDVVFGFRYFSLVYHSEGCGKAHLILDESETKSDPGFQTCLLEKINEVGKFIYRAYPSRVSSSVQVHILHRTFEVKRNGVDVVPVYYAHFKHWAFVTSSLVQALFLLKREYENPLICIPKIASLALNLKTTCDDNTPYAGLKQLPPSCCLRNKNSPSLNNEPFFFELTKLPLKEIPERRDITNVKDACSSYWNILCSHLDKHLKGRKNIALLLSGGLDSSGLLASLKEVLDTPRWQNLQLYTWSFDGKDSDKPYVAELSRFFHKETQPLSLGEAALLFEESLAMGNAPYPQISGAMDLFAHRNAKKNGADILLTGAAGDFVLAGNLQTIACEAQNGHILKALRTAKNLELIGTKSSSKRIMDFVIRPSLRPFIPVFLRRTLPFFRELKFAPWASREAIYAIYKYAEAEAKRGLLPKSPDERWQFAIEYPVFEELAEQRTQLESASALERFDPYICDELLEFFSAIPPTYMHYANKHRGLHREALRSKLPDLVRHRNNKAWFENAFGTIFQKLVPFLSSFRTLPFLERLGIVDRLPYTHLIDNMFCSSSPTDFGERMLPIYGLISTEHFLRGHTQRLTRGNP